MSADRRVLVVDDDPIVAESLAKFLERVGYRCATATSGDQALNMIGDAESVGDQHHQFAVVIIDMALPGMNGIELIRRIRASHPAIVPIMITGYGTIESAVAAIRSGAIDYLTKPLVDEELRAAVEKAIKHQALLAETKPARKSSIERHGLENIIGSDIRMQRMFDVISAVAPSRTTVLMTGESGTGKSLIARAIHRNSPRAERPYVEISCGSIPETLLESELFGHVKGAFTGAHVNKPGRFLAAHTGTLFLDEINSASPAMQLKLLRVLQERTFEPVGSNDPVEVDVRVIVASNQPLEDLVAAGQFRQDLYFRINVVHIELPPLRQRMSDIPVLAEHFRELKARDAGKQVIGFTQEAIDALRSYSFPGNVRELENIIERAVVLTRGTRINLTDLPEHVLDASRQIRPCRGDLTDEASGRFIPMPLHQALEEPEKQIILAALQANQWNRQKTADQLDINRTTLYKKIKQYGLEEYGQTG